MMTLRAALFMAVVGLFATSPEVSAKKNAQNTKERTFHGKIVSVQLDKGQNLAAITVMHKAKAKQGKGQAGKGQAGGNVTKTFLVSAKTQINIGAGQLQKGQRVVVLYHGQQADSIALAKGKGKGKKK